MHRTDCNHSLATPRRVVGSIGSQAALETLMRGQAISGCDWVELRLDLLDEPKLPNDLSWLGELPLLLTARRHEEGGQRPDWSAAQRSTALLQSLHTAAGIDIEVASIDEMRDVINRAQDLHIPWIASFHDFQGFPDHATIVSAAERARLAGAAVFKLAVTLSSPEQLGALAAVQQTNFGLPVACMGMGPLAVVSRLLCAQCGSVLNYGYLGGEPTAPGQWDAARLKAAIAKLPAWP